MIEAIRPDVLVKGGDYRPEDVVGREFVEANGGRLVLVPLVEGHSTTGSVRKLSEKTVVVHSGEEATPRPASLKRENKGRRSVEGRIFLTRSTKQDRSRPRRASRWEPKFPILP